MRTSLFRRVLSAVFDAAGSALAEDDDPPPTGGFVFVIATIGAVAGGIALKEVRDLARRVAIWGDVNATLNGHRKDLNRCGQDSARHAAQIVEMRASIEKLAACIVPNPLRIAKEATPATGLWRDKYLVVRRDGTVPNWPHFVIGARDPFAPFALYAYAREAEHGGKAAYARAVHGLADEFAAYRDAHGSGDPGAPPHRVDDPATIARMRTGA